MRIGFIVDGVSEVRALPQLLARVDTPHEFLARPIQEKIQPKATSGQIARVVAKACRALDQRRADLAVVLIDLEDRPDCPGILAMELQTRIADLLMRGDIRMDVAVVLKVRTFENWLAADVSALAASPRLFPDGRRVSRRVPPGNADGVDGLAILEAASGSRQNYHKVNGAVSICERLDPGSAALNSRSFRRFLRVLRDSRYADQSRLPNPDV